MVYCLSVKMSELGFHFYQFVYANPSDFRFLKYADTFYDRRWQSLLYELLRVIIILDEMWVILHAKNMSAMTSELVVYNIRAS